MTRSQAPAEDCLPPLVSYSFVDALPRYPRNIEFRIKVRTCHTISRSKVARSITWRYYVRPIPVAHLLTAINTLHYRVAGHCTKGTPHCWPVPLRQPSLNA